MSSVCFYFQVHQPLRIKPYRIFDIGHDHDYFNDNSDTNLNNKKILHKVAEKCYIPANEMLLSLLKRHPEFKVSFSISGIALEQFEQYAPHVLESFQKLVETGRVEILSETYYHSLASLSSPKEFARQIHQHRQKVYDVFNLWPDVFRNTELVYKNSIAEEVGKLGFKGMLMEGADHILGWRSPNYVYASRSDNFSIKLLLKNYRLSDDIAFRFGETSWHEYPLTAPKFAHWVNAHNGNGDVINLFMDYETFGEHQWKETGIFNFLSALPAEILKHPDNSFITPSEAIMHYPSVSELDVPHPVSWADIERDLSAWLSNPMQYDAMRAIYAMEEDVLRTKNPVLIADWRKLQTSDHFYYMCTKWFADGDVHAYFNPYTSPYEAFIAYMNVIADMNLRVESAPKYITWPVVMKKIQEFFNN
ncbi:MAG: alpha-amylase [Candidatus Ryanbacteria bacterium CG10_big_fil_rev_8_21_14_0_10_43_42]|uniref:Alpha-amylase n=1 Tax=Candidatus Ryanbacteria bacterium CG10_big_fil_rev_8_21_14_0_10_43_42 TaxID=1974864 RepID=A0A2M8KW70_9BACT|nr:MAG: alpha-amylase [Candidatus Ryanbacteria bacterium CG10_big_fil_rev_8_21_14_0_10_43_42]